MKSQNLTTRSVILISTTGILIIFTAIYVYQKSNVVNDTCQIDLTGTTITNPQLIYSDTMQILGDRFSSGTKLLIFMETYCKACQYESRLISGIPQKDRSNVQIYGVVRESPNAAKEFVEKYETDFPILIDTDGKLFDQLNVKCTPTNLLIKDGTVVKTLVGSPKDEKMFLADIKLPN